MPGLQNLTGGGYQGEGSNRHPGGSFRKKITCRLVPNQNSEDIAQKVKKAILDACPSAVRCEVEVKGGGDPYVVVPPEKPGASPGKETDLMKKGFPLPKDALKMGLATADLPAGWRQHPDYSGSKGSCRFWNFMIGLFTNEDNLHAPNESFHLGIMDKAISTFEKLKELAR